MEITTIICGCGIPLPADLDPPKEPAAKPKEPPKYWWGKVTDDGKFVVWN